MEITANAIQTVAVGADVMFDTTVIPGCQSIMHREGSGLVTLRGITQRQPRARFRVSFGANIAVPDTEATEPIAFAIAISGEAVPTTTMVASPSDTNSYWNISTDSFIDVPAGCCTTIAVTNVGTIPTNVRNANFIVERVA